MKIVPKIVIWYRWNFKMAVTSSILSSGPWDSAYGLLIFYDIFPKKFQFQSKLPWNPLSFSFPENWSIIFFFLFRFKQLYLGIPLIWVSEKLKYFVVDLNPDFETLNFEFWFLGRFETLKLKPILKFFYFWADLIPWIWTKISLFWKVIWL